MENKTGMGNKASAALKKQKASISKGGSSQPSPAAAAEQPRIGDSDIDLGHHSEHAHLSVDDFELLKVAKRHSPSFPAFLSHVAPGIG